MSALPIPVYEHSGPGRKPTTHPDFIVVSHGEHAILMPGTARADRWLDTHIGADMIEEAFCDTGWKVEWCDLRSVLNMVRANHLTVLE